MRPLIAFSTTLLCLAAGCGGADLEELAVGENSYSLLGADPVEPCAWPTAVAFRLGNKSFCTGTLVHPEVVVFAAHCMAWGDAPSAVLFGENGYQPARTIDLAQCEKHPDWELDLEREPQELTPVDFAYCRLQTPVTDVQIVPILMGCETAVLQPGEEVVMVGFGRDEAENNGPKEVLSTHIREVSAGMAVVGGAGEGGACHGDSGGPSFVRNAQGNWRVFGITSTDGGAGCGEQTNVALMHKGVGWIEQQTGIDLTPCHKADGTWAAGEQCGGFALDPELGRGSWESGCRGEQSEWSSACGAPHAAAPPEAKMPPERGQEEVDAGCSASPGGAGGAGPTLALGLLLCAAAGRRRRRGAAFQR